MQRTRLALVVAGILVLAAGSNLLSARENTPKQHGCLKALTAKLGLNQQQQEAIRKIHTDYKKNAAPIKQELRTQYREQRQTMMQVLTEEQRAKLPEIMKAAADKKWQSIAAKLGMSAEQKDRMEKTRLEFAQKFHDLAAKKGENMQEQFRTLRKEKSQAIRGILTQEQFAKLHTLRREQHRAWQNPERRKEFWNTLEEKLGVTPQQKEQFEKIRADFASKSEKPAAQFKQMRLENRAAFMKVLTDEQGAKLQELRKSRGEAKPATTGKE